MRGGTFCDFHVRRQVERPHVGLPGLTRLPVFMEHEMRGVGVIAVQVILRAPAYIDQHGTPKLRGDRVWPTTGPWCASGVWLATASR